MNEERKQPHICNIYLISLETLDSGCEKACHAGRSAFLLPHTETDGVSNSHQIVVSQTWNWVQSENSSQQKTSL